MSSGTLLLCAWGIFNWRPWGRYVAVILTIFGIIVAAVAFRSGGGSRTYAALTIAIVLNSLVLIWLLLPSVRAEYARKALTA
jgi:Mn2+/Fe2+ NRAMP family transporter